MRVPGGTACPLVAALIALVAPLAFGAGSPQLRPGGSFVLEFPDFGTMAHDGKRTGIVEVYLPTDWRPDRSYPLLCWFGGGAGTHKPDTLRRITGGAGFVCAALPYRYAPKGSDNWDRNSIGWGTDWKYYRPMLEAIEKAVGNIDPERHGVMGFSSGGACIGCLVNETREFCDYFHAFGVAGYASNLRELGRIKGKPILMYGGEKDYRMNHSAEKKSRLEKGGCEVELIIYPGVGHTVSAKHFPQVRDWLMRKVCRRGFEKAVIGLRASLGAGKWVEAAVHARKVLSMADKGSKEMSEAELAVARIGREGERLLARLVAGHPSADAVREFASDWKGFPCEGPAREAAQSLAEKELADLAGTSGFLKKTRLRKFLEKWTGFPVYDKALAVYEEEAAKAFDVLTKGLVNARKLQRFIKEWKPAPTTARAMERLEDLARKELDKVSTRSGASLKSGLEKIVASYAGTKAGSEAGEKLVAIRNEAAMKILDRVKTQPASVRKRYLKAIIKQYPGTKAAEEAARMLAALP
ncbi:MAG: alpha/beta hydrolase family protein [Planctomycetota bacterium]|jgi:acetyl esterase/lipase